MGADIHCYCEVRENGTWKKVGKVFKNPYYPEGEPNTVDEDGFEWNAELTDEPCRHRNYNLFAVLADVRNLGPNERPEMADDDRMIPIAAQRGLPDDVSDEVRTISEKGYGHSHSWLRLSELLAFNWAQISVHRGLVDANNYRIFQTHGKPNSYCRGSTSLSISNKKMEAIIEGKTEAPTRYFHTAVEWLETYAESVRPFLTETVPALQSLGEPENVRIVFFFDS